MTNALLPSNFLHDPLLSAFPGQLGPLMGQPPAREKLTPELQADADAALRQIAELPEICDIETGSAIATWPWVDWTKHPDPRVPLAIAKAFAGAELPRSFFWMGSFGVRDLAMRAVADLEQTGTLWSDLLDVLVCTGTWDAASTPDLPYAYGAQADPPWIGQALPDLRGHLALIAEWAFEVDASATPQVLDMLERFEAPGLWEAVVRNLCFNDRIQDIERAACCPAGVRGLIRNRMVPEPSKSALTHRLLDAYEGDAEIPRLDRRTLHSLLVLAMRSGVARYAQVRDRLQALVNASDEGRRRADAAELLFWADGTDPEDHGVDLSHNPALAFAVSIDARRFTKGADPRPGKSYPNLLRRALTDRGDAELDASMLSAVLISHVAKQDLLPLVATHPSAESHHWTNILKREDCPAFVADLIASDICARTDPAVRSLLRARCEDATMLKWLLREAPPEEVADLFATLAVLDPTGAVRLLEVWTIPTGAVWSDEQCKALLTSVEPRLRDLGFQLIGRAVGEPSL